MIKKKNTELGYLHGYKKCVSWNLQQPDRGTSIPRKDIEVVPTNLGHKPTQHGTIPHMIKLHTELLFLCA